MIKLLITDLDDTLYPWLDSFVPAFYALCGSRNSGCCPAYMIHCGSCMKRELKSRDIRMREAETDWNA